MIDIKETVSHHCVSLNRLECGRPTADVSILNELLGDLIKDEDAPVVGKKRHVENTDTDNAPSKRQKFGNITNGTRGQAGHGEGDDVEVPAFKHTHDFTYTLSPPEPDNEANVMGFIGKRWRL